MERLCELRPIFAYEQQEKICEIRPSVLLERLSTKGGTGQYGALPEIQGLTLRITALVKDHNEKNLRMKVALDLQALLYF